jgi:hypothetical protein
MYNGNVWANLLIGKQETVIAGTALMRTVLSEKHTSPMQGVIISDFSVVNIVSFFFIYRIFSSS